MRGAGSANHRGALMYEPMVESDNLNVSAPPPPPTKNKHNLFCKFIE